MFKRILIPLDGTPEAAEAMPIAVDLARRGGGELILLHLLERNAPERVHGQPHLVNRQGAQKYLEETVRIYRGEGIGITWHIHEQAVSDISAGVAEHEDELRPDLVIMRPHGEWNWSNRLFGSRAQQIVEAGPTPLLMLRPFAPEAAEFSFSRILVPLDGESAHDASLPIVCAMATLYGASLHLLTVVPTMQSLRGEFESGREMLPTATENVLELLGDQAEEKLTRLLHELAADGISATAQILRGDPLERIVQYAVDNSFRLTVTGTHGRCGISAFWEGSLASRMFHRLPGSVLLVPVRS